MTRLAMDGSEMRSEGSCTDCTTVTVTSGVHCRLRCSEVEVKRRRRRDTMLGGDLLREVCDV